MQPAGMHLVRRCRATRSVLALVLAGVALIQPEAAFAAAQDGPAVFGIPVDFILFAITLICVGVLHHHTLAVALTGLVGIMSKVAAPVLDVQWATPHLASLGAVVVGRRPYLQMLREAVAGPDPFAGLDPGPIRRSCVPGSAHSPAG